MAGQDSGDRLLTASEAGRLCDVAGGTILRWRNEGLIGGVMMPGGTTKYHESEILAFRAARETYGTAIRLMREVEALRAILGDISPRRLRQHDEEQGQGGPDDSAPAAPAG